MNVWFASKSAFMPSSCCTVQIISLLLDSTMGPPELTILVLHWLVIYNNLCRYNRNAPIPEFSTDISTSTMWQSNSNDSPVSLVVGLRPAVSLSKIFITFSSNFPAKATLQYYSEQASDWRDLQYFAQDCIQSFQMRNDDQWVHILFCWRKYLLKWTDSSLTKGALRPDSIDYNNIIMYI